MSLLEMDLERSINPVDMVEQVASFNDWAFERSCDDEITINVSGNWANYDVSFSWMEEFEALHLACAFDLKVPARRMNEMTRLVSMVNEQMLIGHFDFWRDESRVMFRQSLLLNGGVEPTGEQLECQLSAGLESCERYFQAFQFVSWSGYGAQQALDSALFETMGTA